MFGFVPLLMLNFALVSGKSRSYCTSLIFDVLGQLDLQSMLYNCSNNVQGSLFPPSYFPNENGTFTPTVVQIGIGMNNLIEIDSITSNAEMDFWFRNRWEDPRFVLPPETWNYLNPNILVEGLNIAEYYNAQNQLQIWLPDIIGFEQMDIVMLAELIKLFPNGTIFWSRHLLVTLQESQMNLKLYPMDTQNLTLTLQSFNFNTNFLQLQFFPNLHGTPTAVGFNYDSSNGVDYVTENQLWAFTGYSASISNDPTPIIFDPNRVFSTAYLTFTFQRSSYGIVMRLALPITIFMVIVGFTFWAELDKRVDVTVNMLLVVSALYLVIGQVIPMVGYFTKMDNYITAVFSLLTFTVGIHLATIQLHRKAIKYPLNIIIRDLIVFFFRFIWVPFSVTLFIIFFNLQSNSDIISILFTVMIIVILHAATKIPTLLKSYKISLLNLRIKEKVINSGELWKGDDSEDNKKACFKLNFLELFILNHSRHIYCDADEREIMTRDSNVTDLVSTSLVRIRSSTLSPSISSSSSSSFILPRTTNDISQNNRNNSFNTNNKQGQGSGLGVGLFGTSSTAIIHNEPEFEPVFHHHDQPGVELKDFSTSSSSSFSSPSSPATLSSSSSPSTSTSTSTSSSSFDDDLFSFPSKRTETEQQQQQQKEDEDEIEVVNNPMRSVK